MGLEEIEEHIRSEEKAKVVKISTDAKRRYYEILTESAKKTEDMRLAGSKRIKDDTARVIDAEVNAARVDAERDFNLAYSQKLESNLQKAYSVLPDYVKTAGYTDLLYNLVDRITKSLGEDAEIHVNERDLKTVKDKFPDLKIIGEKKGFIGGAMANSPDGMTGIDLTLEEIIRRKREEIIARLAEYING